MCNIVREPITSIPNIYVSMYIVFPITRKDSNISNLRFVSFFCDFLKVYFE